MYFHCVYFRIFGHIRFSTRLLPFMFFRSSAWNHLSLRALVGRGGRYQVGNGLGVDRFFLRQGLTSAKAFKQNDYSTFDETKSAPADRSVCADLSEAGRVTLPLPPGTSRPVLQLADASVQRDMSRAVRIAL